MVGRKSRLIFRSISVSLLTFLFVFPIMAQIDENPNSPTPIIISEPDSIRALANPLQLNRRNSRQFQSNAFRLNTKVVIFVTNIELMNGEGANAFRVYAEDQKGRTYRMPVLDMRPVKDQEWIYAVTVLLKDEIGFWEQPSETGDVLLRLTWRGLVSNPVKLGLGNTGGTFAVESKSEPTPLKYFAGKPEVKGDTTSEYVGYKYSGDRIRFLEQAAFGPTTALDQRIRRIGLKTWLAEQFEAQYPSVSNPYPDIPLKSSDQNNVTLGCGANDNTPAYRACIRDHYSMYPVQNWFFKEALYGEPQLRHRVAWSLSQLLVISGVDTQQSSHMITYNKILSNRAFGNYRDILKEVTLNPGMGNYLDMARSTRTNPNENFAREILQLFSVGLFMMNQDGTLQLDGSNNPIPTYNQATVNNFTKVLTGWTFCNNGALPQCPSAVTGTVNYKDPMLLTQANHDVTAKTLLAYPNAVNQSIAANLNGNVEIELMFDNVFNHPNVGPFVGRNLIQHMVTSDPTPAYVGRVAAAFNNNGFGVRGDLKAVVRAILLDPEARGDVKTDPSYGKLREPVQFVTNFLRHFNVGSANLTTQSDGVIAGLPAAIGQNPFNSPTVFNFFTPDYMIPGTALNGPEYQQLTTGTAIGRLNIVNTLTYSRVSTSESVPLGTSIDLAEMTALMQSDSTGNLMMDALNTRLLHGTMTPQMRSTILTAVMAVSAATPIARAQAAIYLVATSSQYQVQR